MTKEEGLKKTLEKNWKRFIELSEKPNFQSRFAELQNKFRLPIPSDFPFSIGSMNDTEAAFHKAYHESFPLYLLTQIILYVSQAKYYPDAIMDHIFSAHFTIKKYLTGHMDPTLVELDPFYRRLIAAIDLSNLSSTTILRLIIKDAIAPKWQNRYRSRFSVRIQELRNQGITESHAEAVFTLNVLWWLLYKAFCKDLRRLVADFRLGPEWDGPIFMYAVTGRMLYVPRVNTEPEASLLIPLKYHEMIKAYVQFVRTNQKRGIDVIGRLMPLPGKKQITPVELPPNTKWGNIIIKLVDGENVKITAPDCDTKKVNYKEMGFEDDRTQLPNKQWELLRTLADNHGELSWQDPEAKKFSKKNKQLLSDTLKAYFQIKEDPFFSYRKLKAYKTKFDLIPD